MNINEKLARWQGLENVRPTRLSNGTIVIIYNSNEIVPDYLNDDAAAMSLLDTLVEKGFYPLLEYKLFNGIEQWVLQIWIQEKHGACWEHFFVCEAGADTRREAVVAAVLELIGKEKAND